MAADDQRDRRGALSSADAREEITVEQL